MKHYNAVIGASYCTKHSDLRINCKSKHPVYGFKLCSTHNDYRFHCDDKHTSKRLTQQKVGLYGRV